LKAWNSIKNALGISGVQTNEYAWVSEKNEAQIDLRIERDDGGYLYFLEPETSKTLLFDAFVLK